MSGKKRETYVIAMRIAAIEQHCWEHFDSKRIQYRKAINLSKTIDNVVSINDTLEQALYTIALATQHITGHHSFYLTTTGWMRCRSCDGRAMPDNIKYWTIAEAERGIICT